MGKKLWVTTVLTILLLNIFSTITYAADQPTRTQFDLILSTNKDPNLRAEQSTVNPLITELTRLKRGATLRDDYSLGTRIQNIINELNTNPTSSTLTQIQGLGNQIDMEDNVLPYLQVKYGTYTGTITSFDGGSMEVRFSGVDKNDAIPGGEQSLGRFNPLQSTTDVTVVLPVSQLAYSPFVEAERLASNQAGTTQDSSITPGTNIGAATSDSTLIIDGLGRCTCSPGSCCSCGGTV